METTIFSLNCSQKRIVAFNQNTLDYLLNCECTGQVGLGVRSWSRNLPNAVEFPVTSIILRYLTQECGINI